jgi:hypothetical protein
MSLLGALTPLVKVARVYWARCLLAYTLAGCASASLVGATLGGIGRLLGCNRVGGFAFGSVSIIAILLAAREWRWIEFNLPERKCQTEKSWCHEFGFVLASAMWGLHIGLGFATRVTYGGFWVLVGTAVAIGDPQYGALLMLIYWLGRALPVWLAPSLLLPGQRAWELPEAILAERSVYRRLSGFGLAWSALIGALLSVAAGHSPGLLKVLLRN